jgi:glycosyltransferase involved in cell wall biosynthesis
MKKTKVLHIQLLPLLSGVQRVSLNEITEVNLSSPDKFLYSLVCSIEGPLTVELSQNKIEFFTIPELKRNISPFDDIRAVYKLYKLMKKEKYHVVHTHSSKTGFLGRIAARLAGIPKIVHTVHGFSFPAAKSKLSKFIFFAMEWLAKFATHELIVLNQSDYDISIKQLKYNENVVTIVPNGVNVCKFKPNSIVNMTLRIVMVGRLWEQKNPMCLLLASKLLLEKYDNIEIDFIGDGDLRVEMQAYIDLHKLSNKVKILGWSNKVEKLLPSYDLFVLPSLWEGMPLAILEAQACGLPAIVSDIPGNADLVIDGVNGLLFETNNHIQLFKLIEKMYLTDDFRLKLSNKARDIVCQSFSSEIRNNMVIELYRR